MNALNDLKWLIAVLLLLFVAWVVWGTRGGVEGPFIKPPGSVDSGETYGNPINFNSLKEESPTTTFGPTDTSQASSNNTTNYTVDLSDLRNETKKIETSSESKYKDLVTISSYAGAKQTSVDKERVELRVSKNATEKIPLTGWRLESGVSGVGDTIKKGSYLPYSGQVNVDVDIFIEKNEKIIISTGKSPIGNSFKINKCTGYFEQFQDFDPSIQKLCPKPIDDLPNIGVGDEAERCIDFVEKLPRCEVYLKEIPTNIGGTCTEYVSTKVNYNTCVANHKSDSDFYPGEWRVYLKRGDELWKSKREIIKLIDEEGKVVDAVSY